MRQSFSLLLAVALATAIAQTPAAFAQTPAQAPDPKPQKAKITVDTTKVANPIDPMLYGQFVEIMFGGVHDGLWSEMIRNRSFEEPADEIGLSRYWDREPDERDHDPTLTLKWDASVAYPERNTFFPDKPGHAESFLIKPTHEWDARQRRGLSQAHMPIRKDVPYHGYVWLKGGEFTGRVTVELGQDRAEGGMYCDALLAEIKPGWNKYEFTLTPTRSDPLAKFSILLHGTGHLWVDQVSLMPGDAHDGVRADVYDRTLALRPSFIRWPGGNVAQSYHWQWGIGPRDTRPEWSNQAWWNETETSDLGTDEYLQICKDLGTQPSITVNVEGAGATAQEAANWVEYVNGPATSTYGKLRAANGHPAPYGVKLWEVGNEVFGDWETGHTDAKTYAANYLRYAAAMRAVDPSIKLIAVGAEDMDWNRTVLKAAAPQIDYLALHHYYSLSKTPDAFANASAHPLKYDAVYAEMRDMLHSLAPDGHVKLTINEWNSSFPVPTQHTMHSALYAGRIMNVFERNGDVVATSSVSDLLNGWSAGVIQASRDGLYVTPTYLVNQLYNDHLGKDRLAAKVDGPFVDTSREGQGVPTLDASVSRSADGRKLYFKMVNVDLVHDLAVEIHVNGAAVLPDASLETITSASPDLENSFSTPSAVSLHSSMLKASGDFTITLPRDSVSVLTVNEDGSTRH